MSLRWSNPDIEGYVETAVAKAHIFFRGKLQEDRELDSGTNFATSGGHFKSWNWKTYSFSLTQKNLALVFY